jgi:hypothetical protein
VIPPRGAALIEGRDQALVDDELRAAVGGELRAALHVLQRAEGEQHGPAPPLAPLTQPRPVDQLPRPPHQRRRGAIAAAAAAGDPIGDQPTPLPRHRRQTAHHRPLERGRQRKVRAAAHHADHSARWPQQPPLPHQHIDDRFGAARAIDDQVAQVGLQAMAARTDGRSAVRHRPTEGQVPRRPDREAAKRREPAALLRQQQRTQLMLK